MVGKTNACGGSSADVFAFIRGTYPEGSVCTCSNGSVTLTAPDTSGTAVFKVPTSGTWEITSTLGTQSASAQVSIASTGRGTCGTFALSYRVPVEYQELQYIASTASGGQYVDTGWVYNSAYTITIKFQCATANAGNVVCGAFGGDVASMVTLPQNGDDGLQFLAGIGTAAIVSSSVTGVKTAVINSNSVVVNGTSYSFSTGYTGSLNMYLFAANYAGQTAMWGGAVKIYSFKISSGSTDYIDYVPVKRKSDNKAGFWDVVNKRFITGVGTFTAGAAA